MTALDVVFHYGNAPGEREMRAIDAVWEVYGIRRIQFNEAEHTIRVEYDATRLNDDTVSALLRRAGVDVGEKVVLAAPPRPEPVLTPVQNQPA
jgi:copper chaperone CopZ